MNKNKKRKGKILFVFILSVRSRKSFSKSNVRTVIALANRKQGQSYMFKPSTTLFVPCACFYCFKKCPYSRERNSTISGMFWIKRTLSNRVVCLTRSFTVKGVRTVTLLWCNQSILMAVVALCVKTTVYIGVFQCF